MAHAYLSGENHGLIIGNFIGDYVRGNDYLKYPVEIQKGILLHREIDRFTDSHELFRKSKRLFYNGFEKHSGILVDIYFDHLLAKYFKELTNYELINYTKSIYEIYTDHVENNSIPNKHFLNYVISNDIYNNYSVLNQIEVVLYQMSQRIKHDVALHKSVENFKENEDLLTNHFKSFFGEIKNHIIKFRQF
ncbi:MAG: ACP phosphodiesterase [Bacteroidia bacterium]